MFECFGCLGQSQFMPDVPRMHFGCVVVRLGCILEASWGHLGASWAGLGGFLASLGSFLGDLWEHFLRILCHLEQYAKVAKNIGKPMVFH